MSMAGFKQVMENLESHGIFPGLESREIYFVSPWKSRKIKVLSGSLVTADDKARKM